jgi:hypothetical protein
VQSGGGIKTKMVEAIGYGATVVATESGSIGINENVCGDKLVKVADHDWNEFAKAVKYGTVLNARTPDQYYQHYNWENVIRNILPTL